MLRIFLIIAVVGGLAAVGISGYFLRNNLMTAMNDRDTYLKNFHDETTAHNKTKADLAKTKTDLKNTTDSLNRTKNELTQANGKITDLEGQNKDLTANLTQTKTKLGDAQADLEKWRQLNLSPEQIKGVIAERDKAQKERDAFGEENKLISVNRDYWKKLYNDLVGVNETVVEPPGLKGRVLEVDPKYGFVILDIGSDNNVLERGDLMVSNNGMFVGKVRVMKVEKNRSVANILPTWTRGEINEECSVLD